MKIGDPCTHPVRPPSTNSHDFGDRGRQGRAGVLGKLAIGDERGLYPVEDALDGELVVGEEDEVQEAATLPTPYLPTQSERDDHELTHAQYRSWCEHCVNGRGVEMQHHLAGDYDERGVATVGFDYMFVTATNVYSRVEWSEAAEDKVDERKVLKVLVVRDFKSKALFAHAVRCKGSDVDGFAVQCVIDDLKWLGYSKVILKSDNEPAIVKLLSESLKALRIEGIEQAMEEHPPPYDPQANGGIEIGVKLVKGHLRTMRSALEARVGYRVPVSHPLMSWLVTYSANILTWFSKGKDGRTAYHRVRGRAFNGKLLHFGEKCRYKCRDGGGDRWSYAVFVGRDNLNGQHVLFDGRLEKITRARTLMRLPNSQKWDSELLAAVNCGPFDLHVAKPAEAIFKDKIESRDQPVDAPVRLARRIYLKPSDFDTFGYTPGCPRCEHALQYGDGRCTAPHSDLCRDRIEAELAKTESGQRRIAAATERITRSTAAAGQRLREDIVQPASQGEIGDGGVVRAQVDNLENPFGFVDAQVDDRVDKHPEDRSRPVRHHVPHNLDEPNEMPVEPLIEDVVDSNPDGMNLDLVVSEKASVALGGCAKMNVCRDVTGRAVDRRGTPGCDVPGRRCVGVVGTGGRGSIREVDGPMLGRSDEAKAAIALEASTSTDGMVEEGVSRCVPEPSAPDVVDGSRIVSGKGSREIAE